MKNAFLFVLSLCFVPGAYSAGLDLHPGADVKVYECNVIVAADYLKADEGQWAFTTSQHSGGSHGGEPLVFRTEKDEVSVIADGQWLGLSWMRDGKKIAEGVFVIGQSDRASNRVAILYDPSDSGDQVSVNCGLAK